MLQKWNKIPYAIVTMEKSLNHQTYYGQFKSESEEGEAGGEDISSPHKVENLSNFGHLKEKYDDVSD